MGRGRRALLASLLVAAATMCGVAPATPAAAAPAQLAGGFTVPAGTRLLGAEVPTPPTGSSAYFWVESDAASVLRAFIRQAASLGYEQLPRQPASCTRTPAPLELSRMPSTEAVKCSSRYARPGTTVAFTVWVCAACVHPTAEAELAVTKGIYGAPTGGAEPITPLRAGAPTAKLTDAQQRRAARAIPRPGEAFTADLKAVEFPVMVKGTTALAPALAFDHSITGDLEAVIQFDRNPRDALARILPQSDQPTMVDGGRSFERGDTTITNYGYAYYTTLTLIERPGRKAIAVIEWGND